MQTLAVAAAPISSLLRHRHRHRPPPPSSLSTVKCSALPSLSAILAEKNEQARFVEASKSCNLIPLYRCIFCDHLNPVLAYRCLVKQDDYEAPSFLFESVEQGPRGTNVGRYSVLGAQPAMEIVAKENSVMIMDHEEGQKTEELVDDPMQIPRRIGERWRPQFLDELPDVFCGILLKSPFLVLRGPCTYH